MIYFITGASGAGKTTLVKQLESKYKNKPWTFHHFDHIGVPSVEVMIRDFGSPQGWQEAKTYEWIDRLLKNKQSTKIFLEGQVNLEFIRKGFARNNFCGYHIILIDCNEEEMEKRLVDDRKQPELFTADMKNWLQFLRRQAEELNAISIDSSKLSKSELLTMFEKATGLEI